MRRWHKHDLVHELAWSLKVFPSFIDKLYSHFKCLIIIFYRWRSTYFPRGQNIKMYIHNWFQLQLNKLPVQKLPKIVLTKCLLIYWLYLKKECQYGINLPVHLLFLKFISIWDFVCFMPYNNIIFWNFFSAGWKHNLLLS